MGQESWPSLLTQLGKVTQRPQGLCAKKSCFFMCVCVCAEFGKVPVLQSQGHCMFQVRLLLKAFSPTTMLGHSWPEAGHLESHLVVLRESNCVHPTVSTLSDRAAHPQGQRPEQWFSTRTISPPTPLPPGDTQQCLENFLIVTPGGMQLVCSG